MEEVSPGAVVAAAGTHEQHVHDVRIVANSRLTCNNIHPHNTPLRTVWKINHTGYNQTALRSNLKEDVVWMKLEKDM